MAVEPNPLNANEQIAFYLIESQIADRLIELEDELGPMVELSLYITIEGDDPSRALLTALRKLGVRAYSGSGHYPGYGMHFTFKVLAVLSNNERRIEYAFNGPGGSGATSTIRRTEQGWREFEGRYWMQ